MQELTFADEVTEGQAAAIIPASESEIREEQAKMEEPVSGDEEEENVVKDEVAHGREQFLKIYREKDAKQVDDNEVPTGEIKFRKTQEDEDLETREGRLLRLSQSESVNGKPLIQEITPSTATTTTDKVAAIEATEQPPVVEAPVIESFDWDTAPRIALDCQFNQIKDFVFLTFQLKGYKREDDVRYALSENELLLEVRRGKNVARLCKTL